MHTARESALRIIAASAVFMVAIFGAPPMARASSSSYDVGDQAIVHLRARNAVVVVKTWDRSVVQLEWRDGDPFVAFKGTQAVVSPVVPIPPAQVKEISAAGVQEVTLEPEEFPVTGIALGVHDAIRIDEVAPPADLERPVGELARLTLTIPASTRILDLRMLGRGSLTVNDYHGTTFVAAGAAHVNFARVGGDAFVQPMNGHFYAVDSNFTRLRARSNRGDLVFERCRIKQIEATSLTGNIVYDNGSFEAGLARFESDRGNVALGINGGAQVGAHTQDGHIFQMVGARAVTPGNSGDVNAVVGGGGPVVSALTNTGNVYAYDGSIADRRSLEAPWRQVAGTLLGKRRAVQPHGTKVQILRDVPRAPADRHPPRVR
ncbi:MAG: hypothetical protein ABR591_12700 [Candidatus Velthaea sp.]